jgi:hypothetical protein
MKSGSIAAEFSSRNSHPDKFSGVKDIFFSSTNSNAGRPTSGVGSANISSITTSYLLAVCAFAYGLKKSPAKKISVQFFMHVFIGSR